MVIAESTWVSLLVNAVVNGSTGPHVRLPFPVLAVPAVAAVAVGATGARVGRRWWWQAAVLIPAVVASAAVSAGIIGSLTRSGSPWRVGTQPWTAAGHPAAVTAGAAWFVAGLAWIRGAWLGVAPPSLRHAGWSVGLGGAAFLGIFAGRAEAHAAAFRAATGPAGWLLFVGFPFAAAAVALVREHDLEVQVLLHARSQPGGIWLTVLALPMLGVALVALVLAVVGGPVAPVVGRAAARAAEAIWWLVAAAAAALGRLLPGARTRPATTPAVPVGPPVKAPPPPGHTAAVLPPVVWQVLAAVALVGLVVAIARFVRPHWRRRWSPEGVTDTGEHDSVFTWAHLLSQVLGGIRALLNRLRRRPGGAGVPVAPMAPEDGAGPETVRHAYRRMLAAARASGSARSATETTRELAGRLASGPAVSAAGPLGGLTATYDAVRYGELEPAEQARAHATAQADLVSAALAPPGSGPADGVSGTRGRPGAPAGPGRRPPGRRRRPTPP